jgi:hypothetical protein
MKLLEIAPNFVMSQAGTLMTILQHLESKMGKGANVPFHAISNLMRNVGYSMTFDDFMNIYNTNDHVQKLVSGTPSQDQITLGQTVTDVQGDGEEAGDAKVDAMAKSAAKDINQPA